MTISLFWWRPTQSMRTLAGETIRHGRAWAYHVRRGYPLRNFGDELSPIVVSHLAARPVRWSPLARADTIAVGSLLTSAEQAEFSGRVFGSGYRDGAPENRSIQEGQLLALRGHLTRELLGAPLDMPLGDPGLIVSQIWPHPKARRSGTLFVPHFALPQSASGRAVLRAALANGMKVGLPTSSPPQMARLIAESECVVTNSLHAYIFAHSYDVPVTLVSVASNAEPSFKYRDYASVFGMETTMTPIAQAITMSRTQLIDNSTPEAERVRSELPRVVEGLYAAGRML